MTDDLSLFNEALIEVTKGIRKRTLSNLIAHIDRIDEVLQEPDLTPDLRKWYEERRVIAWEQVKRIIKEDFLNEGE